MAQSLQIPLSTDLPSFEVNAVSKTENWCNADLNCTMFVLDFQKTRDCRGSTARWGRGEGGGWVHNRELQVRSNWLTWSPTRLNYTQTPSSSKKTLLKKVFTDLTLENLKKSAGQTFAIDITTYFRMCTAAQLIITVLQGYSALI